MFDDKPRGGVMRFLSEHKIPAAIGAVLLAAGGAGAVALMNRDDPGALAESADGVRTDHSKAEYEALRAELENPGADTRERLAMAEMLENPGAVNELTPDTRVVFGQNGEIMTVASLVGDGEMEGTTCTGDVASAAVINDDSGRPVLAFARAGLQPGDNDQSFLVGVNDTEAAEAAASEFCDTGTTSFSTGLIRLDQRYEAVGDIQRNALSGANVTVSSVGHSLRVAPGR